MTEQEKFIEEMKNKVENSESDTIEFYGITSETTIKNWEKLKEDLTEANINTFIREMTIDDICKVIKVCVDSDIYEVMSNTYNIVCAFNDMEKIPDALKDMLIDYIELKKWEYIWFKRESGNHIHEVDYVKYIVENFDNIFPEYEFVSREYDTKKYGRIDILAKDKETLKPVIIECKIEHRNPSHQLLRYALAFENPILIGITEEELPQQKKIDGIAYLTYKWLGITKQDVKQK